MPRDSIFTLVIDLIDTNQLRKKFDQISWVEVDHDLKKFIYSGIKKELYRGCNAEGSAFSVISQVLPPDLRNLVTCFSLYGSIEREEGESKQMLTGLTRAIFIWHIATKLVYYNDLDRRRPVYSSFCRISNVLSDYMLYLVLVHPLMLPKDFGEMTKESFLPEKKRADLIKRVSYNIASRILMEEKLNPSTFATGIVALQDAEVYFNFKFDSQDNSLTETSDVRKMNPAAVLTQGYKLAKQLQLLESEFLWDNDDKWGLVRDMWMGIMIHAAKDCSWKEHALVLRHGGELLTYVSLFMAHFGLGNYIHVHDE